MNKIGVHALTFIGDIENTSVENCLSKAAKIGYDVMELPLLNPDALDTDFVSKAYEKFNLNWGVELNENSSLQLSIDNLMDNRTEAFKFSADSPGWRPRNYLQWIPPRSVSLRYTYRY